MLVLCLELHDSGSMDTMDLVFYGCCCLSMGHTQQFFPLELEQVAATSAEHRRGTGLRLYRCIFLILFFYQCMIQFAQVKYASIHVAMVYLAKAEY